MIKLLLDKLSNMCLKKDTFQNYSDLDLMNACLIFSHVLIDVLWRTNQDMTQKNREDLSEATGKALRELIKATTGKDMHIIANICPKEA